MSASRMEKGEVSMNRKQYNMSSWEACIQAVELIYSPSAAMYILSGTQMWSLKLNDELR